MKAFLKKNAPTSYDAMFSNAKWNQRIEKAKDVATKLHADQTRKDGKTPYVEHPSAVAAILAKYTDDEDIIIAGWLHDTIEDVKGYDINKLKADFGEKVASIVSEVSEKKNPSDSREKSKATWLQRKQQYIKNMEDDSNEALMVSCADKIANLRDLVSYYQRSGDSIWGNFNAPEPVLDSKMSVFVNILEILKAKLGNDIVKEYEKAINEAKKEFAKERPQLDSVYAFLAEITKEERKKGKQLVALLSAKGKSKEQLKAEVWKACQKYEKRKQASMTSSCYDLYIVNESRVEIDTVQIHMGGFDGMGDQLIELNPSTKTYNRIKPGGFVLIDEFHFGQLDFWLWHKLKLQFGDGRNINAEFDIGKAYALKEEVLVFSKALNTEGYRFILRQT